MEEFQPYSPEEIILSNLEELFHRSMHISEQEIAHLRELADQIASDLSDGQAWLTSLPDHGLPMPEPDWMQKSAEFAPIASHLRRQISTRQSILLCMELKKYVPSLNRFWQDRFPSDRELSEFSQNRISYQKNNYTEQAFRCFSDWLGEARAAYAHSFSSVCEDVYNGISQYCILPIRNSSEGRLVSFARLIAQYDLKIAATCDVRVGEDKITRFALLQRDFTPLSDGEQTAQFYECVCTLSDFPDAEDLLSAARLCGLKAEYVDVQSSELPSQRVFHGVFRVENGDLLAFLLYLAMVLPTVNSIGHYPHLT